MTINAAVSANEVAISPGTDIQHLIDQSPPGTHFVLKAGVHVRQRLNPKDSMQFRGEPGTVMDGQGVTPFAFEGNAVGVKVSDLEITGYAPNCTTNGCLGAIQGYDARDWTLQNLHVHHNAGSGADLAGRFFRDRRNLRSQCADGHLDHRGRSRFN